MKKQIALLLAAVVLACTLTGCHEADKVNHNMNVAADNFSCERRITVYNARTDKIILYAEGYMSISNNDNDEYLRLLKEFAGIESRPTTEYNHYDENGEFIGSSVDTDLCDLLDEASVEVC